VSDADRARASATRRSVAGAAGAPASLSQVLRRKRQVPPPPPPPPPPRPQLRMARQVSVRFDEPYTPDAKVFVEIKWAGNHEDETIPVDCERLAAWSERLMHPDDQRRVVEPLTPVCAWMLKMSRWNAWRVAERSKHQDLLKHSQRIDE